MPHMTAALQWPRRFHDIVSSAPLTVLAQLESEFDEAEQSDDKALQMAIASNALAFMLLDYARFTHWQQWIERFEHASSSSDSFDDKDLCLIRDTGVVACSLLRGDPIDMLEARGLTLLPQIERDLDRAETASQFALAARGLLTFLQMTRDVADAQALYARMMSIWNTWAPRDAVAAHWRGTWLLEWAQHLSFVDRARLPDAMTEIDRFLATYSHVTLPFGRARLITETAFHDSDVERAARGVDMMLSALQAGRPMEKVTYNSMASVLARYRIDIDTAQVRMQQMLRGLEEADCPPSIAMLYRIRETSIQLYQREFLRAAQVYDECALHAHSAHADVIRSYAHLSRALDIREKVPQDDGQHDAMCRELQSGFAILRQKSVVSFFIAQKELRGELCAVALKEGMETEFILEALRQIPQAPPEWADEHWPWALSLRCFGGFESVTRFADGRNASKATSRPLHLLMLIAAHGQQGITVTQATDYLWPDQDGDQAENSLSTTLLRLRRLYSVDDVILRDQGWLRLNTEKTWTDVRALEVLLDRLSGEMSLADEPAMIRTAKRLFDLYRGDCLRGVDDQWVTERAKYYHARVSLVVRRMIRECGENGFRDALDLLETTANERGLDMRDVVARTARGLSEVT
jgi:hypothetical protein